MKVTYDHCRNSETIGEQKEDNQPTIYYHSDQHQGIGVHFLCLFMWVGVSRHHCLLSLEALSSFWPPLMLTWKQNSLLLTFLQRTDPAQTHYEAGESLENFPEDLGETIVGVYITH